MKDISIKLPLGVLKDFDRLNQVNMATKHVEEA